MVRFSLVCVMLRIMYIAQQAQSGIHLRKLGRGGGGGGRPTKKQTGQSRSCLSRMLTEKREVVTTICQVRGNLLFFFKKMIFPQRNMNFPPLVADSCSKITCDGVNELPKSQCVEFLLASNYSLQFAKVTSKNNDVPFPLDPFHCEFTTCGSYDARPSTGISVRKRQI